MINNEMFSREIILIAKELNKVNGELFLVGGSLRDLVLGISPNEYDFEIYGNKKKKEEYKLLSKEDQEICVSEFIKQAKLAISQFGKIDERGKSFGVIKMENKDYDFSFPRKENKTGISRKDYEIYLNPFLSFKEAQKRRDLTINTLMYSFNEECLIDNFNALVDISEKRIRFVDSTTFIEDPLRVYRIGQFVSRLGFKVDPKTLKLCKKMDISSLSIERIHWEMEKLFTGKNIFLGIDFLKEAEVFSKRHQEFNDLLNNNMEKYRNINDIVDYIDEKMTIGQKWIFVFISLLDEEKIISEKRFFCYSEKTKRILETFTNNKKDIVLVLKDLLSLKIIITYLKEKIDYNEAIFKLFTNDHKGTEYLNSYIDYCLAHNSFKISTERNFQVKTVINEACKLKAIVTGKDLLEIGFLEVTKFKEILNEAIKMQIKGMSKNEILDKIKKERSIMDYKKIIIEKEDNITIISMNSPENLNAFDEIILGEMTTALDNCEVDENCKVIVIKGLGKAFSAGGDIQGMKDYLEKDIDDFFKPLLKKVNILALRIRDIGKPVIASVHGAAAGAGFNLALCCDFIVSSEKAKYVQAFVNIGLIPDMGGTYFLSKALNPSKTMEFAMLGDVISAKKLYELGVINILAEDDELAEETDKLALKLSSKPSESLRKTKELVNKINYPELSEFLDIEYEYQIQLANEKDFAEGINAFLEKRKPQFS